MLLYAAAVFLLRTLSPVACSSNASDRPAQRSRLVVDFLSERSQFRLADSVVKAAPPPVEGSPWPMPQVYFRLSDDVLLVPRGLHIVAPKGCDIVDFNVRRLRRALAAESGRCAGHASSDVPHRRWLTSVNVVVESPKNLSGCGAMLPHLGMDESYSLNISTSGVLRLAAPLVWGAIRGLETVSQLVHPDSSGLVSIADVVVRDFPRFRHRGVLLDTARHFVATDTILQHLEAMAQNKMNVLHWHIVDDQSFSYKSAALPELSQFGSWNPETHVYDEERISLVVRTGRLLGIRVIPEFDTPGHTLSWGYGMANLLTACYQSGRPSGLFGPFDVTRNQTYEMMRTLLAEVVQRFPDEFVHLGGDEVPEECLNSNPNIRNYIREHKLNGLKDLLNRYESRLLDILKDAAGNRKSTAIVWQDVADNGVPPSPDFVLNVWKSSLPDAEKYARRGYTIIFSSCWYIDRVTYGVDWTRYYKCSGKGYDLTRRLPFEEKVLGGEASMWSEYVDEPSLMSHVWPRTAAIAERLWSSAYVSNVINASHRIEEQRCRMWSRGIQVGVLSGPGFCRRSQSQLSTEQLIIKKSKPRLGLVFPLNWKTYGATSTAPVSLFLLSFFIILWLLFFPRLLSLRVLRRRCLSTIGMVVTVVVVVVVLFVVWTI